MFSILEEHDLLILFFLHRFTIELLLRISIP